MDLVPASELGREPVNSVSATVLATVLRELVTCYHQTRRAKLQLRQVQLRCGETLEIHRKRLRKTGEDEGFESDEDAQSTTSSCCLVEDHVFKERKISGALDRSSLSSTTRLSASTDSANSSGSSDTDEMEIPIIGRHHIERFPLSDVIFCHTEPRHPNTIAWVIKKKSSFFDRSSRLGKTGVESIVNESCMEVIVVKCKTLEDFKKLCDSYREVSRRLKLDHYKSVNRKKPIVLTTMTDTKDVKVSLSDLKVGKSSLLKASELSILNPKIMSSFKSEVKKSVSLDSLLKSEPPFDSKLSSQEEVLKNATSLSNTALSKFNLLQRTDEDGMTHTEVSKASHKSKIQKEIEGVILTDMESVARREPIRQRTVNLTSTELKIWRPQDSAIPPQRPERKKYTRKKAPAPKPPIQVTTPFPPVSEAKSKSKFYLAIEKEEAGNIKKSTSQYVRLESWTDKTDKLSSVSMWKPGKEVQNGERGERGEKGERGERAGRKEERTMDRRRARSVGRTSRTTPVPMAHRYIDITEASSIVGGLANEAEPDSRRRRNSFDDMMRHNSTLKSVIKSSKKMHKKSEPKKVTFSAYATVQVVD